MEPTARDDELNQQIMDALIELVKHASTLGQSISGGFGLNGSDVMALIKIDGPLSMKELSHRLACDASFVTAIADSLEKHLLARREPSQRDRRSKNIVLTEHGIAVRDQIAREVTARMPWCNALDTSERECFLDLLQKMAGRIEGQSPAGGGDRVTPAVAVPS
ncbi:MAG: MarR family transcriptional regulator [Streptosporangiaceae bacterium]|nr:MarR family transcriptional regulator [Streptosporangiaceae bacterium]